MYPTTLPYSVTTRKNSKYDRRESLKTRIVRILPERRRLKTGTRDYTKLHVSYLKLQNDITK